MGSISLFKIEFSKESASYYTGELLDGDVVLHLDDSLRFNGIMLRIYGRAKASIQIQVDDIPGRNKNNRHKRNRQDWQMQHLSTKATEQFIDNAQYIYGDGSPLTLESGQYHFPFHFHLPKKDLPTSFEGDRRCYIRYSVTATLDLIDEKDHSVVEMFTLLTRIDVNNPVFQKPPLTEENEKDICCCCCRTGPLCLQASVDRSGYCPGEEIFFQIKIENHSNKSMGGVEVLLLQQLTLQIEDTTSTHEQTCASLFMDTVIGKRECIVWKDKKFRVPVIPPTILCNIVKLSYGLIVTILVKKSLNLSVFIPITIGTIALNSSRPHRSSRKKSSFKNNSTKLCEESQEISSVEGNSSPSSQQKNITVVHKSKSGMELGRFVPSYPCIGTASM